MKSFHYIILCFSLFLNSCSNNTNSNYYEEFTKDSTKNNEFYKYECITDTVFNRERYLFVFNNESGMVSLVFGSDVIDIGRYTNSLVSKPEIELNLLNEKNLGIIIMTHIEQLEKSIDGIYLFSFNLNQKKIKALCAFSDIALHNTESDTLDNIIYFDYMIDKQNNNLMVKEYKPFKNPNNIKQKYKTKSRICTYSLK